MEKHVFNLILAWLDEHQIDYKMMHHAPSRSSIESAQQRGDSTEYGAKALVLKVNGTFILFVMRAYLRLDLEKVQQLTGVKAKKIRFATPEELFALTGLVPGSIPPFGKPILPIDLYIDRSIFEGIDWIGFNAGSLTDSVKMRKEDYLRIAGGQNADFTSSVVIS